MSELNAVIGKVQLKKLDYIIAESGARYQALDQGITSAAFKKRVIPDQVTPAYDTYIVEVDNNDIRIRI